MLSRGERRVLNECDDPLSQMFKTSGGVAGTVCEMDMDAASTLHRLIYGFRMTQLLSVLARLGVPDCLAAGASSAEVLAHEVGADAPALRRVLRALASEGVLEEGADGRFALTPLSGLLRSDAAGSLRDVAALYGEPWLWQAYGNLLHSVRTGGSAFEHVHGEPFYKHLQHNTEAAAAFQRAMSSFTAREIDAIRTACGQAGVLRDARTLIDVGGGHGALAGALLQRHPQLRAVVFDTADVVAAAAPALADSGARITCMAGDFFRAVPAGGDVYLLKSVLHNWRDEPASAILRSCRRAMRAGARLLICERVIESGARGTEAKLFDINMLVTVGGLERTAEQYAALLHAAGLRLQRVLSTASPLSVLEALAA